MRYNLTPSEYLEQAKSLADKIDMHAYRVVKIAHEAGELSGRLDDCCAAGRLAARAAVSMFESIISAQLLNVLEGK